MATTKKAPRRVAVTGKLAPSLVKRLERVAKKLKCSRSRALEQAVRELCERWGA